jgi:hypothetical protein
MHLPEETVRCDVGDHLVRCEGDEWRVFHVEDYVALTRLVVLKRGDEPVDLTPELPDSVQPAYAGPRLMLTLYDERFADRADAVQAIADGTLGTAIGPVCRPLADFPAATTEIVRAR